MEQAEWTPDMALGIPLMDDAHRILVEQIHALQQADGADFGSGLALLIDSLEADFRAEEQIMEAIAYPAIRDHREQHARVLATLHGLDTDDMGAARRAVSLILPWFHLHLSTADTALGIALQLAGVKLGDEAVRLPGADAALDR